MRSLNTRLIEAAQYYSRQGLSVIPVGDDKKPLVKWAEHQTHRATEQEIKEWWKTYPQAMIGVVTGKISGLVVVDIDDPKVDSQLTRYFPDGLRVPLSFTPSGGFHYWFKAGANPPGNAAGLIPGVDFRGEGGYVVAPPSQNGKGINYRWADGRSINYIQPPDLPEGITAILLTTRLRKGSPGALPPLTEGRRDEDYFHVANAAKKGGVNDEVLKRVLETSAQATGFPVDQIGVKIESAQKRIEHREDSQMGKVVEAVNLTSGEFHYKSLELDLRTETLVVYLHRLVREGALVKIIGKNGWFRRIEHDQEEIDFLGTDAQDYAVKWPLSLHDLVRTMPKNVIIVAGATNAGKTAFLLNVCDLNMDDHSIIYQSSEMGAMELRERLKNFQRPLPEWKKVRFLERADHYEDAVESDALNIIDYLECPNDEFWRVAGMIRNVFDKLHNGIAVIALQKPKGRDEGTGKEKSLEKARIALAMEGGVIKIVKAKNWGTRVNPNDMICRFKLVGGAQFMVTHDWHRVD